MSYNIVDHIHKMQVTLLIFEVKKILQQKKNIFKALEDENTRESRIEATTQTSTQKRKGSTIFHISRN